MSEENEKMDMVLTDLKNVIDIAKESVIEANLNIGGLHGDAMYNMVNDFFYGTIIKNYKENLNNKDLLEEYKITNQDVGELTNKFNSIFQKCEDQGSLEKELQIDAGEYQKFKQKLSELNSKAFNFLEDFENYIMYEKCVKELEKFRDELQDMKQEFSIESTETGLGIRIGVKNSKDKNG